MESMNSISGHDTILLVAAYAKRASHLLEKLNKSNKGSTKIDDLIASLKSVEYSINSILDELLVDENLETNVSSSTLNLISTLDSSNCNEMSSIHSGSNINIKRKLSSKDVTEKNEQPVKKKSKDKDKISDPDNNSSNNEDIDTDDAVTKGKRRWEVRRMRQHDVDAVNVNPKETSKIDNSPINAAECAGGAAGGVPKKLNVSASVESAHKQTQSRCLTPKSPSRIPEGDSTNRNNSLWNKKGLKKDPGHSVCPVTSWFCTVCTLENPMRARMCLACNSHRYYGVKNTNGDSSNTELASALLLDNIPGTPRKKNPSMMKSLYVNREPKIGPEHQISLDDLPIPRSELDLYPDVDALGNSSSYWTPSWIPPKDSKYLFDSLAMRLYLSNMESKADEPEALRILYAANFDISAATDAFRNELRERNAMGNWYDSNSDEPPVLHSLNRDSLLPIRSPFVVKLSEVLPPQASQLTTSAIPNNNTSSSSGLSVDSPNYSNDVAICPVYNSFVKCMGMYWKDWNKIVRAFHEANSGKTDKMDTKTEYILSKVNVSDLQYFYYGHFAKSVQYKEAKKDTKKQYRKYAKELQIKHEKEQRALMKRQLIGGGVTNGTSTSSCVRRTNDDSISVQGDLSTVSTVAKEAGTETVKPSTPTQGSIVSSIGSETDLVDK